MVTPRTLDVKTRQKPSSQYTAYIKQKVNRTAVYMTDKAVWNHTYSGYFMPLKKTRTSFSKNMYVFPKKLVRVFLKAKTMPILLKK